MAITYLDPTDVLKTPVRAISFNYFFLPSTFAVKSISTPRRLQSATIQRQPGQLQQTTYTNQKSIEIGGQVYENQLTVDGSQLSCEESIDIIQAYMQTSDDKMLHIRNDRFYNARLSNSRVTYIAGTNSTAAEISLTFIVSDPHQYANTATESTPTHPGTGISINQNETYTINNGGNVKTPLNITMTVGVSTIQSILISTYATTASNSPLTQMKLDSPYLRDNDDPRYAYRTTVTPPAGDIIELNSSTQELNYTEAGKSKRLSYDHIRSETNPSPPIQNLPIEIEPGNNKIGIQTSGAASTATLALKFSHRNRWA